MRPILLVHGATLGVRLFDLPVAGYSLVSALGQRGRAVYGVDIRGYGNSLSGPVMNAPAAMHPPFARLKDAVEDIGTAVKFILDQERASAVDLIGFSWGTVAGAYYAAKFPERVARLALYAPLYSELNEIWRARIGDPNDRTKIDPNIGSYRLITERDIVQRWDSDIGSAQPEAYRDIDLPGVIFKTFAALDPQSYSHVPPAFRSPTGALADLITIFNGHPLYDPSKITMPTLLVRGADDTTSTDADSRRLLSEIASAEKEYRVITPGSHFLCVEKNCAELYKCLDDFLKPS
jgi:pimeloyl-ACP methyl ester carboxylesterase